MKTILIISCLAALAGNGCYHFHHSAGATQQSVDMQPERATNQFTIKKNWVNMWAWGLVGKDIQVDELIAKEIGTDKAVTNLRIDTKMSFLNGLVNLLTLGIYTPQSLEINGEY